MQKTNRSSTSLFNNLSTMLLALFSVLLLSACTGTRNGAQASHSDCAGCPAIIHIDGGTFLMGTAAEDRLTDPRTGKPATNDGPQHEVTVPPFSIAQHEVTVAQFAAFIDATNYEPVGKCMEFSKPGGFVISDEFSWDKPGFPQTANEPVGCVSYYDAEAYAAWLASVTGENYRLPTEAEWEYAARAGSTGPYFWGNQETLACDYANVRSSGADTISKRQIKADANGFPCDDGYTHTSPVASFKPNALGMHDVQGNVWEWVSDCNHKTYEGAPNDGSAWTEENCQFGVIRGGSYLNLVERSSVTVRAGRPRSGAASNMGFRVAKGGNSTTTATASEWNDRPDNAASPGEELFNDNCAACHQYRDQFEGLYGTTSNELFKAIKFGGNNVMSMPSFGPRLTDDEIQLITNYVIEQNNW